MWRPSCLGLCLIAASLSLVSSRLGAADLRREIPAGVETEVVRFEPMDRAVRELAEKDPGGAFAKRLQEAQEAGGVRISGAYKDLNGDGQSEIITVLTGPVTCGARDCEVVILTPAAGLYRPVFDSAASSIALGAKSNSGWRDIITNFTNVEGKRSGVIWTYRGERYELLN
jgi:hypothetical protein